MRLQHLLSIALSGFLVAAMVTAAQAEEKKKPPKVTYDDDVQPILRQKCFSCHNPDKKSGDLDLTNYTNLMLGGGSGEAVVPGDSGSSYLYMLITHDSEPYMPPEQPKLPDPMIETVRKWIDGGVLENKGSKALIKKAKTFDLALSAPSTARPAVPPMPPRLSKQPVVTPSTGTAVASIATNPWSPLAAISSQNQVLLYNTQTLQLAGVLPFPEGFPEVLKFSRNGALLLAGGGVGGAKGKVIVWNVKTGERIIEVGDELDTVLAADISSDQSLIALGGPQRVVRIYSTEDGRLLHELRKHTDWILSLEFSPDSVLLTSGDRNGGLMVWEAYTGREYLTLKAHTKGVTDVSWRSDSNIVSSCSEDGSVRLWEMENGGQVKNWGAHGGGASSIEFARDGKLVTAGRDRVVKLWDQAGKQLRAFEAFGDLALESSICDETQRVIGGDWTGEIRVWNAADGKRVGQLQANPPSLQTRLSEAEKALVGAKAKHQPLVTAYTAAKTAADKVSKDLVTAQTTMKTATATHAKATADVGGATKTLQQLTAAQKAAQAVVAKLGPSIPMLTDVVAKSEAATKALQGDKELAEITTKLKASLAKHSADLKTHQATLTVKTKEIADMQALIKKHQATVATAAKQMNDAKTLVGKLTPQVKPAMDKALAAKTAADQSAAAVASTEQLVTTWKEEIAFATKLSQLEAKKQEAIKAFEGKAETAAEAAEANGKQDVVTKAAVAQVDAANKQIATYKTQAAQLMTNVATYDAAIKKATADSAAATATATKLTGVVQALQAAAGNLNKAAELSGKDKAIVGNAAAVAALIKTQQTAMAAATTLAAAKKKEAETNAANLAKAKAGLVKAQADLKTAEAALAAKTKAAQAEQTKLAATKKTSDQAAAAMDAAQKAIDAVQAEIAAAKGLANSG